ncbi:hypothetical protein L0657_11055 [Dyadobacter sp. CY345]|uniref:hypothetical protein n=1 Tax=Dyadobacter sp. CY345 TaxID=2909335 RepID=UPI001F203EDF|nr:hypothetical protein [Dyadobacter sp. CY345]MCF2444495.1 hypothetical protein [Dyadobacter sp. CY345]
MKLTSTLIFCATALLSGCSPYYYSPNKVNIPNLRERNDMRLDAGFGGGWIMKGADLQAAYAITSHVGIMANGALTGSRESSTNFSEREYTKSRYLEAGLGYFTKFEENQNWALEIFGGGGMGDYKVRYDPEKLARLNMNKFFIQPSLSYSLPRKNIEFGIGSKFSGVDYNLKSATILDTYDFERVARIVNRSLVVFWEPSFRFSAGSETIKGFLSYTPSISILESNIPREIINLNLGIRFTFNTSRRQ